jgi:hypothetical protein
MPKQGYLVVKQVTFATQRIEYSTLQFNVALKCYFDPVGAVSADRARVHDFGHVTVGMLIRQTDDISWTGEAKDLAPSL